MLSSPDLLLPFTSGKFAAGLANGSLQRFGAIIKDAGTGQIVGHMQATGLLEQGLASVSTLNPLNVVAEGISLIQNEQIKGKLETLQASMGNLQLLQGLTLASSMVGIGVTVASTAMILKRVGAVQEGLTRVEDRLEALPAQWRDLRLREGLTDMATDLERLQEAEVRGDTDQVLRKVEGRQHLGFNRLKDGLKAMGQERQIDSNLLSQLLVGLAVSAGLQFKGLFALNELEAAANRARSHQRVMLELSLLLPPDILAAKVPPGEGVRVSSLLDQLRLALAGQPALAQRLLDLGIDGRAYLEQAKAEEEEPFLLVPA